MTLSRTGVGLLVPLAIGAASTSCTIFIHALALITIVHFVRRERRLAAPAWPSGAT
jgi:hypothetical protein